MNLPPTSQALRRALAPLLGHRVSGRKIDQFLSEREFPLVEGHECIFVFRGEAESVRVRHWIHGLPSTQALHRIAGTDVWAIGLELPEGSRVEYKFEVTRHGHTELLRDPLNPREARDPFGSNSVAHAIGYELPEWTEHDPEAREGSLDSLRIASAALGGEREIQIYRPARFRDTRRYSLLIAHDGPDYLEYSGLKTVLDNLIHRNEIEGLIVALCPPQNRMQEYTAFDPHAEFLANELLPALERELPLRPGPNARGLMGASLGAVASLHAAARHPGVFGRLLLQSGSFAFSDVGDHERGPALDSVAEFINAYRSDPQPISSQVFVSCGIHESLIYENRSLLPLLQSTGMRVRYVEARDGHNWENWRDRMREGLSWLFPGPLWMVYE